MILSTHIITGAALASLMPEYPALAFASGAASHFVLDTLPHWDYKIYSNSINPTVGGALRLDSRLLRDGMHIGADTLAGIIIASFLFISPGATVAVVCGMAGGYLPDALQFVYTRAPHNFLLTHLQRFHEWVHTSRRLREEGLSAVGILSQILLVVAIVSIALL